MKQKTILFSATLAGIGLHSGQPTSLSLSPAPVNSGIIFINGQKKIPAAVEQVIQTKRGTSLKNIAVTEHLLAAIYGLEIDNLQISVAGEEVPIMDGSSLPFVSALKKARIVEQSAEKKPLRLSEKFRIEDADARLEARPFNGLKINFMVNFPHLGEQKRSFVLSAENFTREVAPARTFGYLEEVEALKAQCLARGAGMDNALVLGKNGYVNQPRFPDELVRHKILDLLGDVALLGRPLLAEITASRSGHKLNIELVRRLKQS
ncbi:UDP-3-O-[3-hydroxymyristoyl] N-acetylglucosamine deacetylase [Candidatus Saganbacteria bacterium]|nr:UDP-3-O-[3-hydroxymyristoyl] N-acetylglucosamine deacetylase [Candidatus Saganbacteria bacterium]